MWADRPVVFPVARPIPGDRSLYTEGLRGSVPQRVVVPAPGAGAGASMWVSAVGYLLGDPRIEPEDGPVGARAVQPAGARNPRKITAAFGFRPCGIAR